MDWLKNEGVDVIDLFMGFEGAAVLDAFFKSCPKMKSFRGYDLSGGTISALQHARSFWNLKRMREIVITQNEDGDRPDMEDYELLSQIGESFKNLETLEVYTVDFGIDNDGVASLTNCKKLKKIEFGRYDWDADEEAIIDEAVRSLPQCGKLEEIRIDCWIDSTSLTCLVHHCPNLNHLSIQGITDVHTVKKAVSVVKTFSGLRVKKDLKIGIRNYRNAKTWKSPAVTKQLKKMVKENTSGIKLDQRNSL